MRHQGEIVEACRCAREGCGSLRSGGPASRVVSASGLLPLGDWRLNVLVRHLRFPPLLQDRAGVRQGRHQAAPHGRADDELRGVGAGSGCGGGGRSPPASAEPARAVGRAGPGGSARVFLRPRASSRRQRRRSHRGCFGAGCACAVLPAPQAHVGRGEAQQRRCCEWSVGRASGTIAFDRSTRGGREGASSGSLCKGLPQRLEGDARRWGRCSSSGGAGG